MLSRRTKHSCGLGHSRWSIFLTTKDSLFSFSGTIPKVFLRYVSYCIGVASCMGAELVDFITFTTPIWFSNTLGPFLMLLPLF